MMDNATAIIFAFAQGEPANTALFRAQHDDFIVEEELGFAPSGEGEHLFVHIRKRGENTAWIAEKLALFFQVKSRDIGFCGMKDRHAVTSQWFSVYLPGYTGSVDWSSFAERFDIDVEVLGYAFHRCKLRRGAHLRNSFIIRLRDVDDLESVIPRLELIAESGVPNYFGEQRFGRDGNNLELARDWVSGKQKIKSRDKRGMIMSAARSFLFNHCLSARVESGNWSVVIDGDIADNAVPTGSLWGRGLRKVGGEALAVEDAALAPYADWCDHLEHVGLNQERRPLVLKPREFSWQISGSDLILSFGLAPGEYATAVLRELVILKRLEQ